MYECPAAYTSACLKRAWDLITNDLITMWSLGIELKTSGSTVSALNHWAISPALACFFFCFVLFFFCCCCCFSCFLQPFHFNHNGKELDVNYKSLESQMRATIVPLQRKKSSWELPLFSNTQCFSVKRKLLSPSWRVDSLGGDKMPLRNPSQNCSLYLLLRLCWWPEPKYAFVGTSSGLPNSFL